MSKISFAIKTAAAAAALACAAGAHAGTFAPVGGTVLYSTEALGPATPLTLPSLVYTMGVPRVTGQEFAIIYTLPAGATFNATPANPGYANTGGGTAPTITLKRGGIGASEVVYSVTPAAGGPVAASDTFTLVPGVINSHGLTGNGASFPVKITILDQNETACVDNSGTPTTCFKTATAGTTAQSSNFLLAGGGGVAGVSADPGTTTTEVNFTVPLAGFVVDNTAPADTTTRAAANLILKNTTANVKNSTNSADFVLGAADKVTVTLTDPTGFLGLATNGLCLDLDNDGTYCETTSNLGGTEVFTISGNTATLVIDGDDITPVSGIAIPVTYLANGTTPMGVSRVIAAAGSVNPTVAGIPDLTFTGNANWWTWTSNGTVLETPFFTTFSGHNSRFVFMNYGNNNVTYSAECLVETGNTRTLGAGATGTLASGKQTVILATDVCTFSGNTRAGVRFTVNAPNTVIKAVYNSVQPSGAMTTIEMLRPGSN